MQAGAGWRHVPLGDLRARKSAGGTKSVLARDSGRKAAGVGGEESWGTPPHHPLAPPLVSPWDGLRAKGLRLPFASGYRGYRFGTYDVVSRFSLHPEGLGVRSL